MSDPDRNKLPRSLREIREGAAGLASGLVTGAEAELARVAGRVLDTVGVKGEGDVPARLRESVHELTLRAQKGREEVERRVDEGVKAALARVGRPLAEELETLRGRLEKVQQRVDALAQRRSKGGATK